MKLTRKHRLEAIGFHAWLGFCRLLPIDAASAIGGWLGRMIGPLLSAHRTALANIARVMPELDAAERRNIIKQMWEHLGRVGAEIAFMQGNNLLKRVEAQGHENIPPPGTPVIFFSGHIGNWELTYPVISAHGIPVTLVYRHANNPAADAIINTMRSHHCADMLPKGKRGAVRLMRLLKDRLCLAMLVDQKMNEGLSVPFFGLPAMTAPAVAELSLRYGLPIIPVRNIRLKGAHFRTIIYPAIQSEPSGNNERDIMNIMVKINETLESWIRAEPAQWFWVHKRWPKLLHQP